MTPLFKKMNLKDHTDILVLNAPESFEPELAALSGVTIHRDSKPLKQVDFMVAFVQTAAEIKATAKSVLKKAKGDTIVWFAYPKGSSKKYKSEVGRDMDCWKPLGEAGFEGVRAVAIDEDWSGLRFRRVELVKSMSRDPKHAGTKEGKARTKKPPKKVS